MAFLAAMFLVAGIVALASFATLLIWQRFSKGNDALKATAASKTATEAPKEEPKHKATLLFGTQTGTAERFSKQLKTELLQRYSDTENACEVLDIEDYAHEEKLPKEKFVLLLLATYGDGEPTDNAAAFYSWVIKAASEAEKGTGEKLLQGVTFGIFGLGNKQYEHFCAVGKHVHNAMVALGATPIVEAGEGDDDEDIEMDFDKWRAKLLAALSDSTLLGDPATAKGGAKAAEVFAVEAVASYEIELLGGRGGTHPVSASWVGDGMNQRTPFAATVLANRELHRPVSERSCLHVELDFAGAQATYEAGDHVGVLAENEASIVDRAAAALGLSPSLIFNIRCPAGNPHQLPVPFPSPISLKDALAWHTDLLSPVSKPALQALAAFAEGEEARRLRRLLSPEGQEEYRAWQAHSRSLLEVLEEFDGIRPPLGAFFGSIASRLQVRFYSISSSPRRFPSSAHVTCSLVSHPTATGRGHRGVVSHQLQRCKPGDKLPAFLRRSTFKLPADPRAPLIMIGPGTGLAPFRGFLQERAELASTGAELGPAHLFFGCRHREHDYIYEEELAEMKSAGVVSHLHTAFSREGPVKDYVQHHIERHSKQLWELLQAGAYVYVCGEAKNMAKDVHNTLLRVTKGAPGGPERFLADLSAAGRYQKDVW